MNPSKSLSSNMPAMKVLLRVLESKGRIKDDLLAAIEIVAKKLKGTDLEEFISLIASINHSFNNTSHKVKGRLRDNSDSARNSRVKMFMENNPNHSLIKKD